MIKLPLTFISYENFQKIDKIRIIKELKSINLYLISVIDQHD